MTLRLVALMSVVLLLSLASLGFLMNHHQDQVMQEVAQTVSTVGQETLRTLEFGPGHGAHGSGFNDFFFWHGSSEVVVDLPPGSGELVDVTATVEPAPEGAPVPSVPRGMIEVRRFGSRTETADVPPDARSDIGTERIRHVRRQVNSRDGVAVVSVTCESFGPGTEEKCVSARGPAVGKSALIRIDDIRTESDPQEGLVLKIPRLAPSGATDDATGGKEATVWVEAIGSGEADAGMLHAALDEIRLPIPVGDFDELFQKIRDRSLVLFLGVFLVGTVLSAGVASRFTRPIRRLDAGIRRLSEGDLDAEVPVKGSDEIARLGAAFNDMTRKLRANRERSRELVRREKLSSLGRLAAGVAHDVRNPLHSIGLTLQHLRETCRPESGDRAAEFDRSVDIIRGEIRRLDQTVGNFLRFATNERRERQNVNLQELLRETVKLVRKEAEWRNVELDLDIDPAAPEILADGESIRSSVLNLVLNSFEAMGEGGTLGLVLRKEADEIVLEVSDTGKGIPEEEQGRVFDFAYTTREGGNGLGLAIVHQCIVEEHGGRVSLSSRAGEGTRVRLALPHGEPTQVAS